MTNAAVRTRNLALALERLLEGGTMTRADLIQATGLSKATVARLVTELEQAGLAEARGIDPTLGPGRRSTGLGVPSSLGHVIGFSLGLRSGYAVALDLAGRTVGTKLEPTPSFESEQAAIAWAAELLGDLTASLDGCGAPLRISIALPGRVRDGVAISALPAPLSVLSTSSRSASTTSANDAASAHSLATGLKAALGAPVMLATDADMALAGVTALGHVAREASAVLLTMSTALTVATRTKLGVVQARTAAFGNYAALPFVVPESAGRAAPLTLGSVLSVRGLLDLVTSLGLRVTSTAEIWQGEDPALEKVRQIFTAALERAILIAAVTTDPEVCVMGGRLAPLAARVLPELRERLAASLDDPPQVIVPGTDDDGLTTALGSAHTALKIERARFVDRVHAADPQATRQ